MSTIKNYKNDLLRSLSTPTLIELTYKDIDLFSKEEIDPNKLTSFIAAQSVYKASKNSEYTNLLSIRGKDNEEFELLNTLLDTLKPIFKQLRTKEIVKDITGAMLSFLGGSAVQSILGDSLNKGADFILGESLDTVADKIVNFSSQKQISENLIEDIESKLNERKNEKLNDVMEEIRPLDLSSQAKKELSVLLSSLSQTKDSQEIFNLVFKLLLASAKNSHKLIFVKNPHKLDKASLSMISLLLSVAKYYKDEEKHLGLSIVFMYEDENFQPYQQVEQRYEASKKLLDEQRRFAQRYAMLERPSSDLPVVAIKSSMFVGRKSELKKLNTLFKTKEPKETTLIIVQGEPGIGKTSLIKKHIEEITSISTKKSERMIELTLVNEVGHSSGNTGLSALEKSIIDEAKKIERMQSLSEKIVKGVKEKLSSEGVVELIGEILGVDDAFKIGKSIYDRSQTDKQVDMLTDLTHLSISATP